MIGRWRQIRWPLSARPRESGDPASFAVCSPFPHWVPACAGMSGKQLTYERGAADQNLVAVEKHDLDGDVAAFDRACGGVLRGARDLVTEPDAFGLGQRKNLRRIVGADDARAKLLGAAGRSCEFGKPRMIYSAALEMQILSLIHI